MTRRSERRWTLYYPTTRGTLDEMLIDPDVARAMGHHCDGASVSSRRVIAVTTGALIARCPPLPRPRHRCATG